MATTKSRRGSQARTKKAPEARRPKRNCKKFTVQPRPPFVVDDDTTLEQKDAIAQHMTGIAKGRVRFEYYPDMFGTYPGTDLRVPGTEGRLWLVDLFRLIETPDGGYTDECPIIDDRCGTDLRLLAADQLEQFAARLHSIAGDLRADAAKGGAS